MPLINIDYGHDCHSIKLPTSSINASKPEKSSEWLVMVFNTRKMGYKRTTGFSMARPVR
jgi:hypothetical protein